MNHIDLIPAGGIFYKANLHAHTTISDGRWTPEELKKQYRAHGYSVVAYTDHNAYRWHKDLCDGEFVALGALEVNINDTADWDRCPVYHLNFYDQTPEGRLPEDVPLPEQKYRDIDYINGYIADMGRRGFLCCYNHPWWSLQTLADYTPLRGLHAMEIYNHGCELDGLYGYAPQAYDDMLRAGMRIGCLCTDDNHDAFPVGDPQCDSFGGFTMIKAQRLDYASIIEALRAGSYYASTGPLINALYIEDGALHIACSPVEQIYVVTQGRRCHQVHAAPGGSLTQAVLPLDGKEGYIRVDCRDDRGRHAYSNAYFSDSIG